MVALLVAIGVGGTHASRRVAGSNGIGNQDFVAIIGPHKVMCQAHENVPQGTGILRMTIGTYDARGPTLRAAVQRGDEALLPGGRLAAGWEQGVVDVPLGARAPRRLEDVRVCIANRGPRRLAVAGARIGRAEARVAGRVADGRVRIEYIRARPQSGWSIAGDMASRMTFARGLWDGVAPWAALTLVLLGAGIGARALLRLDPRGPA